MWPDRVSNPGPLTYESGVLPIALRGPAEIRRTLLKRRLGHLFLCTKQYTNFQSLSLLTFWNLLFTKLCFKFQQDIPWNAVSRLKWCNFIMRNY